MGRLKALSLGQHKYTQAQQYIQPEKDLDAAVINNRFRHSLRAILRRNGRRHLVPNFFRSVLAQSVSDDVDTCGKPDGCLRIASLNVHLWEDGEYMDNVDRVAKLVNDHEVDILCLQEAPAGDTLNRFMKLTKERFGPFDDDSAGTLPTPVVGTDKKGRYSVVVLSRYQNFEYKFTKGKIKARTVTAQVSLNQPLFVSSIHLNYRVEPLRLDELNEMENKMAELLDSISHRHIIWAGDFNALTREDYDDETWKQIAKVRQQNFWERPLTDVTTEVRHLGFVDCWKLHDRVPPLSTCRFDTRIDYIFASPLFLKDHPLICCKHVANTATDHNMVLADFKL